MIIVHGFVPYRLSQREQAMQLFSEIARSARTEPGCMRYDVFASVNGQSTLFLLQEWEDLDSVSAHFRTEDMQTLVQRLPDVLEGEIHTRRFEVPDVELRSGAAQPVIH